MYQCEQPRENFQLLINKRDFPTQTGIHHLRDSGMNNSTEKSAKQILAIQPNTSPSLIHQFRWFSSATQLRIRITPIVILFVGPAGVPLTRLRPSAERPSTWTPKKPGKTNLRQWLKVFRSYLDISEKVDYYSHTQMIYTYFAVTTLLSLTSSVIGTSSMLHTIQESASSTSEPGSNGPKPARAEWGIWAFTPIGLFLVIMFFGSCMLSSAFGSIPVAMRYLSGERVILEPMEVVLERPEMGGTVQFQAMVKNFADHQVNIMWANISCSCVVLTGLPSKIETGGELLLSISVNIVPDKIVNETIILYTDHPNHVRLVVRVKATLPK